MRLLILLSALAAPLASAQTPGSCAIGGAQEFLSVNEVQAALYNTGSLFFGGSTTNGSGYIVPKSSGASPLFAMSLWVGGRVGGEVRTRANRYSRYQFAPGPLEEGATLPSADCSVYDRLYSVTQQDIATYESGSSATSDLADWPVNLGAPVIDGDGDPTNYNLAGGDRPEIGGEQGVFWVMNDVGFLNSDSPPLGIEVRVLAFALRSADAAIDQGTFYRYRVINRNSVAISDAYVGFYIDPDLGDAQDDYIGSDPSRSMAFVYNAGANDAEYGTPPALGVDLLSGAGSVTHFPNTTAATRAPSSSSQYYAYLSGKWIDSAPMRRGGIGYGGSGESTRFAYDGDPVTGSFWSEVNADDSGASSETGDRRMAISTERFDLAPGESRLFDMAILFAQGTSNLNSVMVLKAASDRVQAGYDAQTFFPVSNEEVQTKTTDLFASPNPFRGTGRVRYRLSRSSTVELDIYDVLGRRVAELVNTRQPEGTHSAELDASALAPGVYVVRLRMGDDMRTTRITVVR